MSGEIEYIEYDERGVKCECGKVLKIPALIGLPPVGEWKTYVFRCACGRKYVPEYMSDIIRDLSDLTRGKARVFEQDEPLEEFSDIEECKAEKK